MRIAVCAVGKMKNAAEAALVDDYLKRASGLGRTLGVTRFTLDEYDPPRGLADAERMRREADWLLETGGDATLIALDEHGENISSKALASFLAQRRDEGTRACAFLIGGADGHGAPCLTAAQKRIAFGKATWPHLLVRAMLAEQLYRAMTILAGHPYHRA